MMLRIEKLLTDEELSTLQRELRHASFVSGAETAGHIARRVKNNQQLAKGSELALRLGQIVVAALQRNPGFFSAALPAHMSAPLFSRYDPGMEYGSHVDNTLMLEPEGFIRGDISATLFLCNPDEYDGGELSVDAGAGVQKSKLAAGDLLLYSSTSIHRVEPVTRGVRYVSVFWVQSMVSDAAKRQILFDLDRATQSLAARQADAQELNLLGSAYNNLLRQWVRPS
jgi:PKHD-type hydroxylase